MPPLVGAEYIAEIACDVGISEATWVSLAAWCEVKQIKLTPWESSAVVAFSREYICAVNEYQHKAIESPYSSGSIDRAKVDAQVRSALRRRR